LCVFFFFQAEDGIRDFHVTGVQTCALPIFERIYRNVMSIPGPGIVYSQFVDKGLKALAAYLDRRGWAPYGTDDRLATNRYVVMRSEERRVGKECTAGADWQSDRRSRYRLVR